MNINSLPSYSSVVIIGGGIMGCSTLYHLAKLGINDVTLIERNKLTSGTTWHSAAQVRALRSTQNMTNLIKYSIELYKNLEAETGQATGWINKGSISIATNENRLTHIQRQQSLAKMFGVNAQSISVGEVKERWPLANVDDVLGAVWSPDDGRISPSDLCAALVKGAKKQGAKIFEDTAVTAIQTRNNSVVGIETSKGHIKCDAVVLCSGLWSKNVAQKAGVEIPVWPCEHFYLLTEPSDEINGNMPTLSDHDKHLYIRDDSGGILIGCFEPMGKAISPEILGEDFSFQLLDEDWDHFEPMMLNALHRLPCLEDLGIKTLLNGPESFTPDGSFLLGESAETKGFYLGCGMNSVGIATGGGAGMALAHCIKYGNMPFDLHEVDPKRFPNEFNSVKSLAERVPEVLGKHYEITYPYRQWNTARNLRQLPLHDYWQDAKAEFGQYFAWERPLYFNKKQEFIPTFDMPSWQQNIKDEVNQAHRQAALFDQSSFGKVEVYGADACSFLNRLCTNEMDKPINQIIYSCMLNDDGGILSDFIAIKLSSQKYRLYLGTTSVKRDLSWLRRNKLENENLEIKDVTDNYAVLALMGPKSKEVARQLGADKLNNLKYYQASEAQIAGRKIFAARLSYVGEYGWEITCDVKDVEAIYHEFINLGVKPSGVFAQTSMRVEKKFLAYGHDIDTDINPIQAGLGFVVSWDKNFIGKQALLEFKKHETKNQIVSIVLDDKNAVPIGNEPIILNDKIIGKTTSAAYGFRIDAPVVIAFIKDYKTIKNELQVKINIAEKLYSGILYLASAYDYKGERMR